jgi:hypothetical protein
MTRLVASAALISLAVLGASPARAAADADTGHHHQAVRFAKGADAARLRGTIRGDADVDYTVTARAGQTLAVKLQSPNPSLYFNINPPGSADASMFIGNLQGQEARVMLPADGTYVIRVYLMRNAARRNEKAPYAVVVAVTGQALPPLSAARDALVAGTPFHATASVPCQTPGAESGAGCKAGVIRRGREGTATVDLRGANALVRQVLFVKGQPVASDSAQPMTSSRQADRATVRFGSDEWYEIPDALLTGG